MHKENQASGAPTTGLTNSVSSSSRTVASGRAATLAIVVATGADGAVPLWRVTAGENKIIARHGTVADFSKMQRVASLQEKLGQKGKLD